MANQKLGNDKPTNPKNLTNASINVFGFVAEIIPNGIPKMQAIKAAIIPNSNVTGNAPIKTSLSGWALRRETPRSPEKISLSQFPYWTIIGSFKPSLSIIILRLPSSIATSPPLIASITSPGRNLTKRKTITVRPKIVGTVKRSLLKI